MSKHLLAATVRLGRWLLVALIGLQLMCSSARSGSVAQTEPPVDAPAQSSAPELPQPQPATREPAPVFSLTSYDALRTLQGQGLSFGALLFGNPDARTAKDLSELAGYRDLVREISTALTAARSRDSKLGEGMAFGHREFPAWWLSSPVFHYELVAIVNRIDRHPFNPQHCGELRFIYRLAYRAKVKEMDVASRLPMTLNVVAWLPGPDCKAWLAPLSELRPDDANRLTAQSKLLSTEGLAKLLLKSVEINLQSARWPSTVRPNMAGHAEYLLRVLQPESAHMLQTRRTPALRLRAAPLENTPDIARLGQEPQARRELLDWLTHPEQLQHIDRGTLVVPERFLDTTTLSVAPHGLSRLTNRPYSQLFSERELAGIDLGPYRTFKSSSQLLRRLDGLSCPGCHQSRSMAGFHLLGEDAAQRTADALDQPLSPHALDEQARRATYWTALTRDEVPDDFRPAAERPKQEGGYGDACQLNNPDWPCSRGLACVALTDQDAGHCLPTRPVAGNACEPGTMNSHRDPHRDFLKLGTPESCGAGGVCERSAVGFPSGMCAKSCASLQPGERCGAIAVLDGFNTCLARKEPFEQCIQGHARPAALRACSATEPCRDDYVCARTKDGLGACIPPYFLFQLRVDGHVFPKTSGP